jgi:hypothetical protein
MAKGPEKAPNSIGHVKPDPSSLLNLKKTPENDLFFDESGQLYKVGSHIIAGILKADQEMMDNNPDFEPWPKSLIDTSGNEYLYARFKGLHVVKKSGVFEEHEAKFEVLIDGEMREENIAINSIFNMSLAPQMTAAEADMLLAREEVWQSGEESSGFDVALDEAA